MAGFDFGRIGGIISKYVDSDFIDIKRDINGKLQEIYSNIPCHVAYASTDNPDPTSVDVKPIIQSITVHLQLWVDIQNNDFLIAKKVGSDGSLIGTYSGRCGNPVISQGRKKVSMQMSGTEAEEATPLPPKEGARITIRYVSDGEDIQESAEREAEVGGAFEMEAPIIEGYRIAECWIDGELQESADAYIAEVKESGHEVRFVYSVSDIPEFFRFLVNGLYAKDDGSLDSGWHLYKKIDIDSYSVSENVYTIVSDDVRLTHEDGGQTLAVSAGARMVLIPGNAFVEVAEIVGRNNGSVTFRAVPFAPTEAERNCYTAGWYDD